MKSKLFQNNRVSFCPSPVSCDSTAKKLRQQSPWTLCFKEINIRAHDDHLPQAKRALSKTSCSIVLFSEFRWEVHF